MHPFVLVPLIGQILVVISLFLKGPGRKISLAILISLGLLVLLILLTGIMGSNWRVMLSTVPFLSVSGYYLFISRKKPGAVPGEKNKIGY
jgi:hypothetical protein